VTEEGLVTDQTSSIEQLPMHMYNAVIQELKQQKHELQSLQQVERRRAKTSDNISAAILSNLSSGVLFFTVNGLVRQSNAAAKQILGFGSPVGMSAAELFRSPDCGPELASVVTSALREQTARRCFGASYRTPAGDERTIDITVTVVRATTGDLLGAACLINDRSELAEIQRQVSLRGEMSAEMAFELRNSLATISGYAQQLAAGRDPDLARQLASDIAAESAHLDRTIGGFLASDRKAEIASRA
jgi:nitrogen fixation/metabolism regulation signal transduction histidine kinase